MSIRVKLTIINSLVLLLIFSLFTAYNIHQDMITIESAEQEKSELLVRAIQSEIDKNYYTAFTTVQVIASNEMTQKLFAERDRKGLLEMLLPIYRNIQSQITQFHFHLPDSTSFLRVHLPDSYGDDLKDLRHTVNLANATQGIVSGIEEGITGLGYRVVVPVFYEGHHQGTVEMGSSLGSDFLYNLKEIYGPDIFLYDQNSINYIAATLPEDIYPLAEEQINVVLGAQTVFASSDDHKFGITLLPLIDFSGDVIAYYKIVTDNSALMSRITNQELAMALILLGAVVITASVIMITLQSLLLNPLTEFNNALKKVANLDFTATLKAKTKDEIGEIAQNLNHTVQVVRDAMNDLKTSHELTLSILNSITANVYVIDTSTFEILYINKYGRDLYGDVVGQTCWKAIQKDQSGPCAFCMKNQFLKTEVPTGEILTWELKSTFNQQHYEYRCCLIKWIGGRLAMLAIATDNTEQKLYKTQLEFLSLHDSLTGLYNKAYHSSELHRLEGGREYPVTIIFADLDDLKVVNDNYSHKEGDRILQDCANLLKESLRKGDILSRVGGDEFVMLMPRTDRKAGEAVIQRIRHEIDKYNEKHQDLPIRLSIGLAVSENASQSLDDTSTEADRMMYRSKPKGRTGRYKHNSE